MGIRGVSAKVSAIEARGTVYAANLEADVEDAELRKEVGQGFDGMERVFARIPTRDGGEARVELKYVGSGDPAPQLAISDQPIPESAGPHHAGQAQLTTRPSGRTVDHYRLEVDADHFELADIRSRKITFEVEARVDGNTKTLYGDVTPGTLWR
jgi:hypothetical protein